MERGHIRQQLIAELSRSPHAAGSKRVKGEKTPKQDPNGRLAEYTPVCFRGATEDPDFYAHLLSWNLAKGQVKDSRVALPVIALSVNQILGDREWCENALSHVAALDPRLFLRAVKFSRDSKVPTNMVRRLVQRYLRDREADRGAWDRAMLQHRRSMSELYARFHVAPGNKPKGESYEWNILNGVYDPESPFAAVASLKDLPMAAAAAVIARYKISPLVSLPALGAKAKDPNVLLEMIKSMTPTQLISSMKLLEKLGARQVPMLRAAIDEALEKAKTSKRSTLKTTQAAQAVDEVDEVLSAKLRAVQEKQIEAVSSVDGDWVVLGDKSGSMSASIEIAKQVAALLTRAVKGNVYLVFFDTHPSVMNLTGKTYEEIQETTKRVMASGGTALGCGLNALLLTKTPVDGIVLVSDGAGHQAPYFPDVYARYCKQFDRVLPVYFYRVPGEMDTFSEECRQAGIEITAFDVNQQADYYSLPNMIQTMRVNHYSLVDEIMRTPLLKLSEVLSRTTGMEVIGHATRHATTVGP